MENRLYIYSFVLDADFSNPHPIIVCPDKELYISGEAAKPILSEGFDLDDVYERAIIMADGRFEIPSLDAVLSGRADINIPVFKSRHEVFNHSSLTFRALPNDQESERLFRLMIDQPTQEERMRYVRQAANYFNYINMAVRSIVAKCNRERGIKSLDAFSLSRYLGGETIYEAYARLLTRDLDLRKIYVGFNGSLESVSAKIELARLMRNSANGIMC